MNSELVSEIIRLRLRTAELVIDYLPHSIRGKASKLHNEIISAVHAATADAVQKESEGTDSQKIDID